jgi:IPT/TIG domain
MSRFRNHLAPLLCSAAALLAACSGEDSTISGVAATGLAIAHTAVTGRCATGTVSGSTDATGNYVLPVESGVTLPCLLRVASTPPLHTVATSTGTNNITPVSELIVARAAGTADTASLFSGTDLNFSTLSARLGTAADDIRTQLAGIGITLPDNPLTAPLVAASTTPGSGNAFDQALDQLKARLDANSITLGQLATLASNGTQPLNFSETLSNIPSTGGGTPAPVGLTVSGLAPASGAVGSTVTITGTGFDTDLFHMQVLFSPSVAAEIVSGTASQLVVKVPDGANTGVIQVKNTLSSSTVTTTSVFEVAAPTGSGETGGTSGSGITASASAPESANGLLDESGLTVGKLTDTTTRITLTRGSTHVMRVTFNTTTGAVTSANFSWLAESKTAMCGAQVNIGCDGIVVLPQSGTLTVTNQRMVAFVSPAADPSITVTLNGSAKFTMPAVTWTNRASPSSYVLQALAYGNGKFVAVGMGKSMLTSTDGISWSTATAPSNDYFSGNAIASDGAMFVMVGDTLNATTKAPLIATSTDGSSWTVRNWTHGFETSLADVTMGGGRITAVGTNGTLISSTDGGSVWTNEATGNNSLSTTRFRGVTTSGTVRVAVGSDSGQSEGRIFVNGGSGWTAATTAITDFCPRRVIWNGTLFLAVGGNGCGLGDAVVMSSTDGSTWTRTALPSTVAPASHALVAVVWDGNRFHATGDNLGNKRVIVSSPDGLTWIQDHTSTATGNASLGGIATSGTRIVAVGGVSSLTKP